MLPPAAILLGVGALFLLGRAASTSRTAPAPAPSCKRFGAVKKGSLSTGVLLRARAILNDPTRAMGSTSVERWDGKVYEFVVEIHPGDAGIATPHRGVTVFQCMDAATAGDAAARELVLHIH